MRVQIPAPLNLSVKPEDPVAVRPEGGKPGSIENEIKDAVGLENGDREFGSTS